MIYYLLINTIRNIFSAVKKFGVVKPADGKAMVEEILLNMKYTKVIKEYLHKNMPAKYFQNYIWAISEIRPCASDFLNAFNEFNVVFPTFEMGFECKRRVNIAQYTICCVFVSLLAIQFVFFHFFFNNFITQHTGYAVPLLMVIIYAQFEIYERAKKLAKQKINKIEDAKIQKLAEELDKMLIELTSIDENAQKTGDSQAQCDLEN